MKKSSRIILNAVTVVVLNLVFWLSNYYPRHLIERLPVLLLMNFLYCFVYFSILIIVFGKNRTIFDGEVYDKYLPWYKRIEANKLLVLMLCQAAFDGITYWFERILPAEVCSALVVILTAVWWIVVYSIITAKKEDSIFSQGNFATVWVITILGAVAGAVLSYSLWEDSAYLLGKFEADSEYIAQYLRNIDWKNGLICLGVDSIVGILLVVLHDLKKTDDKSNQGQTGQLIIRVVALVFSGLIIYALKTAAYPVGSIEGANAHGRALNQEGFCYEKIETTIKRVSHESEAIPAYSKVEFRVKYSSENEKVEMERINTIVYDPALSYNIGDLLTVRDLPANAVVLRSLSSEYKFSGSTVYLFGNFVICYEENDVPYTVMLSELDEYGEHDLVVKACKEFLREGNIALFEYCCDYLMKYDRGFIEPYIERIAAGDFTEAELSVLETTKIRRDFVIDIASRHLHSSEK